MWDTHDIPYNKRYNLLLVDIEMVSLLMCGILPYNYSKHMLYGKMTPVKGNTTNYSRTKMLKLGKRIGMIY